MTFVQVLVELKEDSEIKMPKLFPKGPNSSMNFLNYYQVILFTMILSIKATERGL